MRSIEALFGEHTRIWFSVGGDEGIRSRFMEELVSLGLNWVNGRKVSEDDSCSYFMGIGPSRKVGHVSWQIWRVSMLNEAANPDSPGRSYSDNQVTMRIDYERYTRGDEEYLVTENIVRNVAGSVYPTGGRIIFID